jgi:3-hydroxyisobutyrate dehydrogenase
VLGAGIMGSAMARRLLSAGFPVTVWDRSVRPRPSRRGRRRGRCVSREKPSATRGVVITMLPTVDVVNSVIFDGGVVGRFRSGLRLGPDGHDRRGGDRATRDRLAARRPDVVFVDAPVSGSKGPAERGRLLILASGPAAAAKTVGPVFAAIGRKTIWLGERRQGQPAEAGRQRVHVRS